MAISGRYTAVLDACVLFPRLHRDILLSIAHADLYTARWSAEIEKEWTTSYKKKYPDAEIHRLVDLMRQAVPDALVVGYEEFISAIQLPDPDDRHVVAALIIFWQQVSIKINIDVAHQRLDAPNEACVYDLQAFRMIDYVVR